MKELFYYLSGSEIKKNSIRIIIKPISNQLLLQSNLYQDRSIFCTQFQQEIFPVPFDCFRTKAEGYDGPNNFSGGPGFSGFIGGRYFFNNKLGVYAELGYGVSTLNAGVAFKLSPLLFF